MLLLSLIVYPRTVYNKLLLLSVQVVRVSNCYVFCLIVIIGVQNHRH